MAGSSYSEHDIVQKAKEIIQREMGSVLSLQELASEIGIAVFTLQRIFKARTGQSIAAYYLQARIERAKELLTSTRMTLQAIAEAVGYTEGNNFQIAFKRVTGMTPGEWRRGGKV